MIPFLIDVEDASGNRLGPGPIASATYWRSEKLLDRAGSFEFAIPATEPRAEFLTAKRTVRCWAVVGGLRTEVGAGTIEAKRVSLRGNDIPMLVISGPDLLRELSRVIVAPDNMDGPNVPGTVIVSYATVGNLGAAWTRTGELTTNTVVYVRYSYDTLLSSLVRIGDSIGEHFRLGAGRSVYWVGSLGDFASSGVRAVTGTLNPSTDPALCYILDIEELEDSAGLHNYIWPFGAGEGDARLNMAALDTWPAGLLQDGGNAVQWGLDEAGVSLGDANQARATDGSDVWALRKVQPLGSINVHGTITLENLDSVTAYRRHGIPLAFKDIIPVSNSDADLTAAANYLAVMAYHWLRVRDEPALFYKLSVTGLQSLLEPGETLRVVARKYVDGEKPIDINAVLNILGVTVEIDARGLRTSGLTVANVDRWPESNATPTIQTVGSTTIMQAHPQMNASVDTVSYEALLDAANSAILRFWFGSETTTVNQAIMRFRVDPVRSVIGIDIHNHPNVVAYSLSSTPSVSIKTTGQDQFQHNDTGIGNPIEIFTEKNRNETLSFGIFEEVAGNTYAASLSGSPADFTEIDIAINGGAHTNPIISEGNGWFSLDLTPDVSDLNNFRPSQEQNTVEFSDGIATVAISSISISNYVVTVNTSSAHGLATGDNAYITGTTNYNGIAADITVIDTDTFTYVVNDNVPGSESAGYVQKYKTARITAQIERRTVIQSVAIL